MADITFDDIQEFKIAPMSTLILDNTQQLDRYVFKNASDASTYTTEVIGEQNMFGLAEKAFRRIVITFIPVQTNIEAMMVYLELCENVSGVRAYLILKPIDEQDQSRITTIRLMHDVSVVATGGKNQMRPQLTITVTGLVRNLLSNDALVADTPFQTTIAAEANPTWDDEYEHV